MPTDSPASALAQTPPDFAPHCLVCGSALGMPLHACPQCKTPFHEECWQYQGGCAVFGCTVRTERVGRSRTAPAKPTVPPRWLTVLCGVVISTGLLVVGSAGVAWFRSWTSCPLQGFPDSLAREVWRESLGWPSAVVLGIVVTWFGAKAKSVWVSGFVFFLLFVFLEIFAAPRRDPWFFRACANQTNGLRSSLDRYARDHEGWYPRDGVRGQDALREWAKETPYGIWFEVNAHHALTNRLMARRIAGDDFSSAACFFTYIPGLRQEDDIDFDTPLVIGYWPDFVTGNYCVITSSGIQSLTADSLSKALDDTRRHFERAARPFDPASFILRTDYR